MVTYLDILSAKELKQIADKETKAELVRIVQRLKRVNKDIEKLETRESGETSAFMISCYLRANLDKILREADKALTISGAYKV